MTLHIPDVRRALQDGPTVLLLRHAPREHISDPTQGHDAALTAEGRVLARTLGATLGGLIEPEAPLVLGHSPVPRCKDTASEIRLGMTEAGHHPPPPAPRGHLGGPYLRDSKVALELARDTGAGFLRMWFDGRVPQSLVDPLHVAAQNQVERAMDALGHARLAVLVSHDWNLMLVREHYFGVRHEDAGWIEFLDGIAMAITTRGPVLRYRGQAVPLGSGACHRLSTPDESSPQPRQRPVRHPA